MNVSPIFVTDLPTLIPLGDRQLIGVDGYSEVGDGGAGTFFWNAAYTGPTSPINVVPTGVTTGAWSRVLPDSRINVRACGATGTGSTDDTEAIQTAINLCG